MFVSYVTQSLAVVLSPLGIGCLFLSVLVGLIFGMLPGLTATMGVALLTGLTYSFEGPYAILVLLGIYIGAISGGNQSAILLNIPGTPASASTALEGHPLALKGEGGLAIFVATSSSFFGTLISICCVVLFTPLLTSLALKFNSQEMFLLAVFGVVICGNLTSGGDPIKGWISGFFGLLVALVGRDTMDSFPRFTFGQINLTSGISLLPVMIGLFGFPEVVNAFNSAKHKPKPISKYKIKDGNKILKRNWFNILRSGVLGMSMGAIPGVGEDTGGWVSYWAEKKKSKTPELWGKGCYDGICSSECGNNAAIGGAIIPVLSLAVPGSAPAAVLLAAFWMHGYRPGPLLMSETPEFLYFVVVFMVFASFVMLLLANVISKYTVKILQVDDRILMPVVFILCVIGAFVVNNRLFDIKMMVVFGMIGLGMAYIKIPSAPLLLGVILGNMADENLRRALILHDGSWGSFFTRPISIIFMIFILILIVGQNKTFIKITNKIFKKKKSA